MVTITPDLEKRLQVLMTYYTLSLVPMQLCVWWRPPLSVWLPLMPAVHQPCTLADPAVQK